MSAIVLDASAGVELVLQTPLGRRPAGKIPPGTTTWVPEHYYAEVTAVLRRHEIDGGSPAPASRWPSTACSRHRCAASR